MLRGRLIRWTTNYVSGFTVRQSNSVSFPHSPYMAYNVQPMMRVRFNIWRGCEEGRPGGGAGIDDSRGLPASLVAGVASLLRNGAVCSKSRLIISNCFSFLFGLVICCWPDLCSNLRSRVSRCDYARFQLLACACA